MNIKKIIDAFFWLIFFVFLALMGLTFISSLNSNLAFKSFLVQSGSMEPAIMTGDIIIVKSFPKYVLNDVVTFTDNAGRVVTHRILEENASSFTTKGDANRTEDKDEINQGQIIGKVVFTIPKLGYAIGFSRTLPGIIILVMIPASLIIYEQAKVIFKAGK